MNQSEQDQNAQYNLNDVRFNVELINTYRDVITSPVILEDVIDRLDLSSSLGSLEDKIKLSNAQNSQVVKVTVTDTDQGRAAQIANTTVEVFQEKLPELMNVDNVKVLSEANIEENPSPVSPNVKSNIAIALVLGGMVGLGLTFLLEYLDTTITNEKDVERHTELPVLGVVSSISDEDILQRNRALHTRGGSGFSDLAKKKTV